ncbi:MAG: GGDEF domain-containing protein [Deltaproteobacteria bacterium]|nr:GGDEF domain-containing protein [Deltaproteobacteria bacterium]
MSGTAGADDPLPESVERLIPSEDEALLAIRDEVHRTNAQRARLLGPMLVLVHLVHVVVFHFFDVSAGARVAVAEQWRARLVVAHATAAVVTAGLALTNLRRSSTVAGRALPLVGAFYLVHGAWVASIDQLVTPAMTPYVISCVGVAVVVVWSPRIAIANYLLAYAALAALCWWGQPDLDRRVSILMNGLSVSAVGLGLSFYVWRTITRRTRQRALIDAQHRALARLATHDALTDLPNRRLFSRALGDAVRAMADGRRSVVALLDLDHFKTVNDEHGHEVGDLALIAVAALLRDGFRTDDVAARLGGEEFGILLTGTDAQGAATVLEELRARIAAEPIGRTDLRVTASIGFAELHAGDVPDGRDALRRADEALYAAKAAGRDRIQAG